MIEKCFMIDFYFVHVGNVFFFVIIAVDRYLMLNAYLMFPMQKLGNQIQYNVIDKGNLVLYFVCSEVYNACPSKDS